MIKLPLLDNYGILIPYEPAGVGILKVCTLHGILGHVLNVIGCHSNHMIWSLPHCFWVLNRNGELPVKVWGPEQIRDSSCKHRKPTTVLPHIFVQPA